MEEKVEDKVENNIFLCLNKSLPLSPYLSRLNDVVWTLKRHHKNIA